MAAAMDADFTTLPPPLLLMVGELAGLQLDVTKPLEILTWTHENLAPWTADDARTNDNYAMRKACDNGHLSVAQWLVATFGLTADDARSDDNDALCMACEEGHLDVAQWLVAATHTARRPFFPG